MKKLFLINEDLSFYNDTESYKEIKFRIVVNHDNSKEDVNDKFEIYFCDDENNIIQEIRNHDWIIKKIRMFNYYGRVKSSIKLIDPYGKELPEITSSGCSLEINESNNLHNISYPLISLIKEVTSITCFRNYRAYLDYTNYNKK